MGAVAAPCVAFQRHRNGVQAAEGAVRLQQRCGEERGNGALADVWRWSPMTRILEFIGQKILYAFRIVGEVLILLKRTLFHFREAPRNLPSIFTQIAIIGYETVPIASVMAFFVGMVLALQTGTELYKYGTQDIIGSIVGLSMVREL